MYTPARRLYDDATEATMTYRIIQVPLFDVEADGVALAAAFAVARRFDAHVCGLFPRPDPRDVMPVVDEGITRSAVMDDLMRAAAAEVDRRRDGARARFEAARAAAAAPLAEAPPAPGSISARWSEVAGRHEETIPREAHLADLVAFGRGDGDLDPGVRAAFEATLLGSARPLLLAPPSAPGRVIGNAVAVAWNGSPEATRALIGAMPFLERADAVHVLTAATWRTPADAGERLATYLAWHGIRCERRPVELAGESRGAALLRAAREVGADLLVMGGRGRPRLTEMILGGATNHVATRADLPVLMAH